MMDNLTQKLVKALIGMTLLAIMLASCLGIVIIFFSAAWLHTYNAFTSKEKIAEIEVKSTGKDEEGIDKFELKYTEINGESGLIKFIFPNRELLQEEPLINYTMYGDSFWIELHVAKLPDFLTLANFKSLYKITGIGGDFIDDKEIAKNLPTEKRSIYSLNGGVDDVWKWIKQNDDSLTFIIDSAYFVREGDSIPSNGTKKWDIFITEEGLLVDSSN